MIIHVHSRKNHRESRWILGIAILAVPTWVVWCAWAILGAVRTRDAAVAIGLLVNATILLLLGPVRKLYLLNKYQALVDEEEKKNLREQQERGTEIIGDVVELLCVQNMQNNGTGFKKQN